MLKVSTAASRANTDRQGTEAATGRGNNDIFSHFESTNYNSTHSVVRNEISRRDVTKCDSLSKNSASPFAFGKCCEAMTVHSRRWARDASGDSL
jgi:hypothetical protein